MITIDQLLTAPDGDAIFARFITNLVAMKIPADKWRAGGSGRLIARIASTVYSEGWLVVAQAIGAGFLPKASGPWLFLLAHYVYGVEAIPASFATGLLTLTNRAGGVYSYAPGEATFQNSATGKTYTNDEAISLAGGSTGSPTTQTIAIVATEVGASSSAPPGAIDTLVTVMLGVTCSNSAAVVGQDAQSDDDLRALCLAKLGSLSVRGPRSAYDYAIRTATRLDGSPVNINRWAVSSASSTGTVTVYLAAPSGTPDPTDVDAVVASIEAKARPEAVTVSTSGATAVAYTASLTVWCLASPGFDSAAVQLAVEEALLAYFTSYRIGGLATGTERGVFASAIDGVVRSADPSVFAVDGAIDLALTAGEVATDSTTVTVRPMGAP